MEGPDSTRREANIDKMVDKLLKYNHEFIEQVIERYRERIETMTYDGVIYYDAMKMEESMNKRACELEGRELDAL